jgi:serine/threonine protein kinase
MIQPLQPSDPKQLGPWTTKARLGQGGMGVVFLAEKDNFQAAIKVVRTSFLDDQSLKSRIIREIDVLKKIKSPFVAAMIEADVSSESAWFATEYVEGLNLKQYVEANGPLNSENWLKLAQGLLSAFETIHKQNVIHRDIKPSNILLGKTGAKIIDFGIALTEEATSLTTTGLVAGSPAWLSPEQINDNSITSFSDIFSLGSVLTFAATGLSPWNKDSSTKTSVIFHKILTEEPNLTGLTDFQKEIVSKLLEKDPKKRPSAKEAKKLFESKIGHDLTLISPKMDLTQTEIFKPTIQTKAKKPGKKPIFISAIAASVLLISSIFFINNSNQQADNLTLSESLPIDTASEPQPEAISSTPALSSTPVQTPIPEASAEVEVVPTEEPTPETTQEATPKASPVAEEVEAKESPKASTSKTTIAKDVDLSKTKICLTINQHDQSDTYCFKPSPKKGGGAFYTGDYSNIVTYESLYFLSVPFTDSPIRTCLPIYERYNVSAYLNSYSTPLLYGLGTASINMNETFRDDACNKFGDFGFSIRKSWNPTYIPWGGVVPFELDQPLPQKFNILLSSEKYTISHIYTWSFR